MIFLFEDKVPFGAPSWHELVTDFGPYLGSLVFFIIIVVFLQWYWYRKNILSKNQEIERGVKRVTELEATIQKQYNQLRSFSKK